MAFVAAVKAKRDRALRTRPTENNVIVTDIADCSEDELMDGDMEKKVVIADSCDWIQHVMVMPWKELFLHHLSKEGWTWTYGPKLVT